jgi:hypothetical protein
MKTLVLVASALSLTVSNTAMAQGVPETGYYQSESRASIGLTIPFGRGKTVEHEPRVEIGFARDRYDATGRRSSQAEPVRLAVTLGDKHRLLLNGREVQGPIDTNGNRKGINTLGGVALGLGVVLLVGVVIVATAKCEPNIVGTC